MSLTPTDLISRAQTNGGTLSVAFVIGREFRAENESLSAAAGGGGTDMSVTRASAHIGELCFMPPAA